MTPTIITIGSRGSKLALWQARHIESLLRALGAETRLEIIKTTGDKITDVPLAQVGSKGLFTKEIEEALLAGTIDLAVHSLKDLPTVVPEGLAIAAIPERELPFDALIGKKLAELPHGAKVGTSSLRRAAQLRARRPDLHIESLRGNLDTRLRKLDEGQYDAIVLASAGLRRLGWASRIAELLSDDVMCPAVGQGALAIETRDDNGPARRLCAKLDHAPTRACITAERALLAALGGGCQVPIGAHARLEDGRLSLFGVIIDPQGETLLRHNESGSPEEAELLGIRAARALLSQGGRRVLSHVYGDSLPLAGQRVVVTRARQQAGTLSHQLRELGADVVELPVIEFAAEEFTPPDVSAYAWVIFTSANGVDYFFRRAEARPGPRYCAIGPATAKALGDRGIEAEVIPDEYVAEGVVAALSREPMAGQRILIPRAAVARDVLPLELERLGAKVDVLPVYRTGTPEELPARARSVFATQPDWVTVTSSSTVKHLVAAVGETALAGVRLASIGPVTSDAARQHGLTVALEANPYTIDGLVAALSKRGCENAG